MLKFAFTLLIAVLPMAGQMGMGMRPPNMPGAFRPVVGNGATYKINARKADTIFTFAIVGQEGLAYWMEIRTSNGQGDVVMKQLVTVAGEGQQPQISRMIVQTAGQPPMELPTGMMNMQMGRGGRGAGADTVGAHGMGTKVGTESITVPAGTFECDHYTSTSADGKKADVWLSTKVSPYGLVKMVSSDANMELQKVLEHETSQIKGEPAKMNIPGMPGR
jgi:hypothetical protein